MLPSTDAAPSVQLRDPNDDPILADAEATGADVLMTGDRDFLDVAKTITTLAVLTPRQVYERL
ncbi:MAG: hypothetical protein Rubg2KO_14990 [Rubricoccaceae bacterium]